MKNRLKNRGWISWIRARAASAVPAFALVLFPAVVAAQPVDAQGYRVLYSFTGGTGGATPYGGLLRGRSGVLYGTTFQGGVSGICSGQGCGVVYKLDPAGNYTVLHSFTGIPNDGGSPFAELIIDKTGNLYGTTNGGGTGGLGTVFKMDRSGIETVLHSFNGADGSGPYAALIRDSGGNFYSTTYFGGASDSGVVCKVDSSGRETVLYNFTFADGRFPSAGLVRDKSGNLYGTTNQGGDYGYGTVFKLNLPSRTETVLHSFTGGADGQNPLGGLIIDAAGNLYGTASGGTVGGGGGVVFKLDMTGQETVIYSFTAGTDGSFPGFGYLVRDTQGSLYGVTNEGGDLSCGSHGCGVVFNVDPNGIETVLHAFHGGTDGQYPNGGLIQDAAGNLYGTTNEGGASGYGTVFKLTP